MHAKLIQTNDGFQLYNLAEVRFFLKVVDRWLKSPVISDSIWEKAKEQLASAYGDSSCLDVCLKMIEDFEAINRVKYRTDLEEFIRESNCEDFYADEGENILVSTIHKAKGREFDSVYMLMNQVSLKDDEDRRKLFVGIMPPGAEYVEDSLDYPAPAEIILSLSCRDVVLDFFKGKKEQIVQLHSGAKLDLDENYLSAKIANRTVRVVKYSKACAERLAELENKGYAPCRAEVRFIVAWKGEEDDCETAVILPDIYLKMH